MYYRYVSYSHKNTLKKISMFFTKSPTSPFSQKPSEPSSAKQLLESILGIKPVRWEAHKKATFPRWNTEAFRHMGPNGTKT